MTCEDVTHKRTSAGMHQVAEAQMNAYVGNNMLHFKCSIQQWINIVTVAN